MRLVAPLVGALLVVSACGEQDSVIAADESPLADYMGIEDLWAGGDDASMAAFAEQEQKLQESIAECMAGKGFEYHPVDTSAIMRFVDGEEGLDPESREWVEKYGFGVTTQAFSQTQVGPNLVGHPDFEEAMFDEEGDPNFAYVQSLNESEREAYETALYGGSLGPMTFDETMTEEEVDAHFDDSGFGPEGCLGDAYGLGEDGGPEGLFAEFGEELESMYMSLESDPRFVEAMADVESCVTEKGLDFVSPPDAWEHWSSDVDDMQDVLWSDNETSFDEAMSEDFNAKPPELSDEMKAKLGELQEQEITMALAVYDCGGSEEKMGQLAHEIRIELEHQFIEEHKEELDKFKEKSS